MQSIYVDILTENLNEGPLGCNIAAHGSQPQRVVFPILPQFSASQQEAPS